MSRHIQPGSTAYLPGGRPAQTRSRGGCLLARATTLLWWLSIGPCGPQRASQECLAGEFCRARCGLDQLPPTYYPGLSCSWNNWVERGAIDNRVLFVSLWLVAEVSAQSSLWQRACGVGEPAAWWTARGRSPTAIYVLPCAGAPWALEAHTCQYLFSLTCNKSQIYIHVDYRVIKFVNI